MWRILEDSRESAQSSGVPVVVEICARWSEGYLTYVMPVHAVVTQNMAAILLYDKIFSGEAQHTHRRKGSHDRPK